MRVGYYIYIIYNSYVYFSGTPFARRWKPGSGIKTLNTCPAEKKIPSNPETLRRYKPPGRPRALLMAPSSPGPCYYDYKSRIICIIYYFSQGLLYGTAATIYTAYHTAKARQSVRRTETQRQRETEKKTRPERMPGRAEHKTKLWSISPAKPRARVETVYVLYIQSL